MTGDDHHLDDADDGDNNGKDDDDDHGADGDEDGFALESPPQKVPLPELCYDNPIFATSPL